MENNKQIGKVINYDGFSGQIVTGQDIIHFSKDNIQDNISLENGIFVEFYKDTVVFDTNHTIVARKISPIKKESKLKK